MSNRLEIYRPTGTIIGYVSPTASTVVNAVILKTIDVINVQKIIINVNKRVYSEKDSKRL